MGWIDLSYSYLLMPLNGGDVFFCFSRLWGFFGVFGWPSYALCMRVLWKGGLIMPHPIPCSQPNHSPRKKQEQEQEQEIQIQLSPLLSTSPLLSSAPSTLAHPAHQCPTSLVKQIPAAPMVLVRIEKAALTLTLINLLPPTREERGCIPVYGI